MIGPAPVLALLVGIFHTGLFVLIRGSAGGPLPLLILAASLGAWAGDASVYPKPRGKEREAYEESVSDHLPTWATFRTGRDNDP